MERNVIEFRAMKNASAKNRVIALSADPPRASGFIVTMYGDIAEPRSGTLSMATLIDCCAAHGISSSLVRTAVSRLVANGRLVGEKKGRRSFYRLTDEGREEFASAARVFYAPPPEASGWLIALGASAGSVMDAAPAWVRLGPDAAIAPDRSDLVRPAGSLLSSEAVAGEADLPAFAASHWPLDEVADRYRSFIEAFQPIADGLHAGHAPSGPDALALRLRLVHRYRYPALADPRLPRAALPRDWPGHVARRIFIGCYLALAAAADRHIGETCEDAVGLLAEETAETRLRIDRLRREAIR